MGKQTRALYARGSVAFEIARLAYEPLTSPLVVVRERVIVATFRAIDMANWSLDDYDEARAEHVLARDATRDATSR